MINKVCDGTTGLSVTTGTDMFIRLTTAATSSGTRGVYAVTYVSVSG